MFNYFGYNVEVFNVGNIGNWDVSNVTDMHGIFDIGGLSGWDVPLVTTYTDFNLNVESKVLAPTWVNENVDIEE